MLMDYIEDASSRISIDVCGSITDLQEKEDCIKEVTEHLRDPEEVVDLLERICDIIIGVDLDGEVTEEEEKEVENEETPVLNEEEIVEEETEDIEKEEDVDDDEDDEDDNDDDDDDNDDDDDEDEEEESAETVAIEDEEARKAEEKARKKAEKKAKKEAKKAEKKRQKEEKKRQKQLEEEEEKILATSELNTRSLDKIEDEPEITCNKCKVVVEALENFANDPEQIEKFLNSVFTVCAKLRDDIRNECNIVIPLYAPYVIDALQHGLPPERLCVDLEMC